MVLTQRSWILWVFRLATGLHKYILGWRQTPGMALMGTLRSHWEAPASAFPLEVSGVPNPWLAMGSSSWGSTGQAVTIPCSHPG